MTFSVSVIIPAYNVERFIKTAIDSALNQLEVNEVIVINDGSTDKTLEIVELLQLSCSKVKIYQHKEGLNKGRSATRNLGIQNATSKYIAFLDADDFYLPNRFSNDSKIFKENPTVEGIYNAVGFHFYRKATKIEIETFKLNTVSQKIRPEDLFEAVISSKYGYLHLNGLTVKKSVFDKIGFFNESLMVAEDSDIIYKMALKCYFVTGIIDEALAKRGIHDSNVFDKDDLYKKYNIKLSVITWGLNNKILIENIDLTLNWLWVIKFRKKDSLINYTIYWARLFLNNHQLLFSYLSVKYFPIIRLRQDIFSFLHKKK